jgi:Putative beta barrel porin-7 (BBP7)
VPINPLEAVIPGPEIVHGLHRIKLRKRKNRLHEPNGGRFRFNKRDLADGFLVRENVSWHWHRPTGNSTAQKNEAAMAAETFAMHRMTQPILKHILVVVMATVAWVSIGVLPSSAQPPVRHADADYDASGYVVPAGMVHPSMYYQGNDFGQVAQVGYLHGGCDVMGGCDSYPGGGCHSPATCDGMGGCGSLGCGGGGLFGADDACGGACGGHCGGGCSGKLLDGGLMGHLRGCGCGQCGSCLSKLCLFCRGSGCEACQLFQPRYLLGALASLRPYTEAGLCAQRWYDVSAEAVFLSHSNTSAAGGGALTSRGVGPLGPIVLNAGNVDSGNDLEAGMRLSAAFIFGAGGNIEATYMGNNEWNDRAAVTDPTAGLFSFISEFGTNPGGSPAGFDDTDRSILQSVEASSEFHSAELNYRRRTMGPYCRFQGSWLVGLRYLRYQDGLMYATLGQNDNTVNANLPRFFTSDDELKNRLFGPQAGFDLWWNVTPGVNLGIGMKGAWVQNDIRRRTIFTANSINLGGPGTSTLSTTDQDTTVMGEFETKLAYRLSHSWTVTTSYYLIGVDDIAVGTIDNRTIRDFVTVNPSIARPALTFDSLTVQGIAFGAEYIW